MSNDGNGRDDRNPRTNDRWDALPDVVAQLQSEASSVAPRARVAAAERPTLERPIDAAFRTKGVLSERLTGDDDRTILRARPLPIGGGAAKAPAAAAEGEFVDADIVEEADAIVWPGLEDYDALLAENDPDPRQLFDRVVQAADALLGERGHVLRPLYQQLRGRLDALVAAETKDATQLEATTRAIDKLEDLFVVLMVRS